MKMPPLRTLLGPLGLAAAIGAGGCRPAGDAGAGTPTLEHGRYLAENIGMCVDCHTPMGPHGPMMERHLMGARIVFEPTVPVPDWIAIAPPIAGGFPGWSREQLVQFLETGVNPDGKQARPPMPHFRFNHTDAEAVADYLVSLKPQY